MTPSHLIIGLLAVLSCIGFAVLVRRARREGMILSNIGESTHADGNMTKLSDAANTTRFVFGKAGTDAAHVAVAGAGDLTYGIITDEAAAAEFPLNVRLHGQGGGTRKVTLGGTVAFMDEIVPTTGGVGLKLPTASGTYYPCARALAAGVSGDVIEVMSYVPVARVIP